MTDISSDSRLTDVPAQMYTVPSRRGDAIAGDLARTVFGQVMGLVALTVGCAALALTWAQPQRRHWDRGVHRRVCLRLWAQRGLRPRHDQPATGLLFGLGLLLGLAVAPVLAAYAKADPSALSQAGRDGSIRGGSGPTATPRGGTCPRGRGRCSGRCWV